MNQWPPGKGQSPQAEGESAMVGPPEANIQAPDRILTLPNAITTVRLLCAPLFLWLLFGRPHGQGRYQAALLLGALGATDWVDGYLARHLGQVSTVGKVLDPTADRILLGVGVVGILIDGSVPLWVGIVVLTREVLVALAVLALAAAGAKRMDVQWAGKAGTLSLFFAFPLFLVAHSTAGWKDVANVLAWLFVIPGICLAWYAAITYVPMARRALAEGRAGRGPKMAVTEL